MTGWCRGEGGGQGGRRGEGQVTRCCGGEGEGDGRCCGGRGGGEGEGGMA